MRILHLFVVLGTVLNILLVDQSLVIAKPDASAKFSVIREENPAKQKETLILPYAFPSESMGTTFGVGGLARGYGQDQLLFGGAAFASGDDAYGFIGGMWDYQLPFTDRLFFTAYGSLGHYPRQRAYTESPRRISSSRPPPAGSNDSDENNFVEDEGDDNWFELKLEYVLPVGAMRNQSIAEYQLRNGILQTGATGGNEWNPLQSGITVLLLGQSGRYQSYQFGSGATYDGDTFPAQIGLLYDNTDFPSNPTIGSSQYIGYQKDFGDAVSGSWSFVEFEASKYFDLGPARHARQRVVALNMWTGSSPSWEEEQQADGGTVAVNRPPFFEGARLGGFFRMRGYPSNRFNDRSVIYTTAEYRYTLKWNPFGDVSWLRWLKTDWFQLVGFVEGGRVAGDYDFSELFTDWKVDGGIGIRALFAGSVVRFDMAASEEGFNAWAMFGQPF